MKFNIILFFSLLVSFSLVACASKTDNSEDMLQYVDGMTLEEAIQSLKDQSEEFNRITNFYNSFKLAEEDIVDVPKEDEKYTKPHQIMFVKDLNDIYMINI